MSPEDLNQIKRFCSPQDQIQWGILFLSRNVCRMNGSGRANKGTFCAYRYFGIIGSAGKRAGRRTGVTKTGF
jgi:hypothetical protein